LECQKKRGEEEDRNHNSPSHQKITKTKTKQNPKTQKKKIVHSRIARTRRRGKKKQVERTDLEDVVAG
jgi:hypothetical protein